MNIVDIFEIIAAIITGIGASELYNWKARRRKSKGEVAAAEFKNMMEITDSYIAKVNELARQVVALQQENLHLKEKILDKNEKNED